MPALLSTTLLLGESLLADHISIRSAYAISTSALVDGETTVQSYVSGYWVLLLVSLLAIVHTVLAYSTYYMLYETILHIRYALHGMHACVPLDISSDGMSS